jgi:hypothetical protein
VFWQDQHQEGCKAAAFLGSGSSCFDFFLFARAIFSANCHCVNPSSQDEAQDNSRVTCLLLDESITSTRGAEREPV